MKQFFLSNPSNTDVTAASKVCASIASITGGDWIGRDVCQISDNKQHNAILTRTIVTTTLRGAN